jgi:hypothetical protein
VNTPAAPARCLNGKPVSVIATDYGGYAVSFPVSQLTGVLTLSPALAGAAVPIAARQIGIPATATLLPIIDKRRDKPDDS